MAIYIELTTDPFDAKFADKAKFATASGAGLSRVRRPLRGLEIKEETYAYLKLIRVDGEEIHLFDSSDPNGQSTSYANFILQSVQEQRMERHQIIETFGDTYLFLFGESPRFLNVNAVLINSNDFNWKAEFQANYEKYLRGTRCVEMGARMYLFYDQNIIEGYMLNTTIQESADNPMFVPISFQIFVTNTQNISLIGSGNFPIRPGAIMPEGIDLQQALNGEQLDLLLQQTTGPTETGFNSNPVERQGALRSLIANNADEFTAPEQPSYADLVQKSLNEALGQLEALSSLLSQESDLLDHSLSNGLGAYGVTFSSDPALLDKMGVGPTFLPVGVSLGANGGASGGALATFGASAHAGAFAGGGAGIGAKANAGFGSFSASWAGVGASAKAGAFFGASLKPSTQVSLTAAEKAQAGLTSSFTSKSGGQASAFASVNATAQQGAPTNSYAYATTKSAAQAGGYTGANAYLGFQGSSSYPGASHAGAQGSAGASVYVGGQPTAFSFVSAKGSLTNVGVPPNVALQASEPKYSWSGSWPSPL